MFMFRNFSLTALRPLPIAAAGVIALSILITPPANAGTILLGITGDGASTSETLFQLSTTDASLTFFMTLGNGDDGETIGYNPADGLLYHASGLDDGDRFWESINVNTKTIVTSGQFTGPDVDDEQLAMTYNPATGRFLVTDRDDNFFDTTLAGAATDIGDTDDYLKGLAFVGGTLYGATVFDELLLELDPLDGTTLDDFTITLDGGSIDGVNGLATHPDTGVLWGIIRDSGDRFLATIDHTTGAATSVGLLDDSFAGIAFVQTSMAVPEPGTMALLGFGLAGLGFARRKKASA